MRKGQLKEGKKVALYGYFEDIRDLGGIKFLIFRDNEGKLQVALNKTQIGEKLVDRILATPRESVIKVTGTVKAEPRAPGGVEIVPVRYEVVSEAEKNLPIDINKKSVSGLDLRLDWRFLDLRTHKSKLIFLISSDFERWLRDYFYKKGAVEVHTPKLMGVPSESGAELFRVEYFNKTAYLAQSPQFYKQMAICAGFEKVFEIGPVFRAEPSFTSRHVTEFTSVDAELAHIKSVNDVMRFQEKGLAYALSKTKVKWGETIKREFGVEVAVPKLPFPRITMKEAHEILGASGKKYTENEDISNADEAAISDYVKNKFGHDFVFVTEYPWAVRPFYHMRKRGNRNVTLSYDLLYKGLEITTGAQREHRYGVLAEQAKEKGLDTEKLAFYLNFFKYGAPPHGGLGMGLARTIKQLLGMDSIQEVTLVPRDPNRLYP